jgi:hypothetical protein
MWPENGFESWTAFGDDPSSVLHDMEDIVLESARQLENVKDEATRSEAVEKLESLAANARELQKRASRLGPISEDERVLLIRQYNDRLSPLKTRLENAAGRLREQNLGSVQLFESSFALALSLSDLRIAMDIAWKELPQPRTKREELEHAKVEIKRDLWRALAVVVDESGYVSLHTPLLDAANRYRDLIPLQREITASNPNAATGRTPYSSILFDIRFQTADKLSQLRETYGEKRQIDEALAALADAENTLTGIEVEASNQNLGPPAPPQTGNMRQLHQQQRKKALNQGGTPSNRNAQDTLLDLGAPEGAAGTGPEQALQRFVRRMGQENVVILRVSNGSGIRPGPLTRELAGRLGTRAFFATLPAEDVIISVRYSGELDDVIPHIYWGRVESIDHDRRLLRVKIPAS